MDAFSTYSLLTSLYLLLQALPLLFSPRLILTLLSSSPSHINSLSIYLCRSISLVLFAFSLLNLLLSGLLPLQSPLDTTSDDIYAGPTLVVTTGYHAVTAFYLYTQTVGIPVTSNSYGGSGGSGRGGYGDDEGVAFSFALASGLTISAMLAVFGVGTALFGGEKNARVSRTTGADKNTASWPFRNVESAREKKRVFRRMGKGE